MGKRKTGRRFNPLQTNNSVAEPLFPQFTKQNPLPLHPFSHNSVSLREVSTGKLQTKGGARNPRSFLKLDHLKNLAVWASKDASIPSLAAFFGRQVAAAGETIAAPPDLDTVSCQRRRGPRKTTHYGRRKLDSKEEAIRRRRLLTNKLRT